MVDGLVTQIIERHQTLRIAQRAVDSWNGTRDDTDQMREQRAELGGLLQRACDAYRTGTDEDRSTLRSLVADQGGLAESIEEATAPSWREFLANADTDALDAHLASLAWRNGYPDTRDMLLELCATYLACIDRGIDPMIHFCRAAMIAGSSGSVSGFDVAHALRDFERSAVFQEQISPLMN